MYSVKGDTVLDPFLGTGTTLVAAMASGRNGTGFEMDATLAAPIRSNIENIIDFSNGYIRTRIQQHIDFADEWIRDKGPMKHLNQPYGFPVMTGQERELILNDIVRVESPDENRFEVLYEDGPCRLPTQ